MDPRPSSWWSRGPTSEVPGPQQGLKGPAGSTDGGKQLASTVSVTMTRGKGLPTPCGHSGHDSLGSLCPALMMGKAQAQMPGLEADLSREALQWGSFSAPTPALLPEHWTHWAVSQIPSTQAQLHSGPAWTPALGVSMEGPLEPSPRPGVSRQHPQSAQERGPVRAHHPPPTSQVSRSPPSGRSQRGLCALPGPLAPSQSGGPCPPSEPTGKLSTEVSCHGLAAGRPPATTRPP